jgi:hypothetical protein
VIDSRRRERSGEARSGFHFSILQAFWQPGLPCRWPVTQSRVWPDGVLVNSSPLSQHSDSLHRVEDLSVQKLIPQVRVEALTVTVPPRTSSFDCKPSSLLFQPAIAQIPCYELRSLSEVKMDLSCSSQQCLANGLAVRRRQGWLTHVATRPLAIEFFGDGIRCNVIALVPIVA